MGGMPVWKSRISMRVVVSGWSTGTRTISSFLSSKAAFRSETATYSWGPGASGHEGPGCGRERGDRFFSARARIRESEQGASGRRAPGTCGSTRVSLASGRIGTIPPLARARPRESVKGGSRAPGTGRPRGNRGPVPAAAVPSPFRRTETPHSLPRARERARVDGLPHGKREATS